MDFQHSLSTINHSTVCFLIVRVSSNLANQKPSKKSIWHWWRQHFIKTILCSASAIPTPHSSFPFRNVPLGGFRHGRDVWFFLDPSVVALVSSKQMGRGGVRFEIQRAASRSSLLSIRPLQSMTPHWLTVTASEQKQETCTHVCTSFHTLVPLMEVTLNLSYSNSLPQQSLPLCYANETVFGICI